MIERMQVLFLTNATLVFSTLDMTIEIVSVVSSEAARYAGLRNIVGLLGSAPESSAVLLCLSCRRRLPEKECTCKGEG